MNSLKTKQKTRWKMLRGGRAPTAPPPRSATGNGDAQSCLYKIKLLQWRLAVQMKTSLQRALCTALARPPTRFEVLVVLLFHPICEHRPICRRARRQMGCPICQHFTQSADILSNLQTGRRQMGWSHLATFCPICRRAVGRWGGPIWLHFAQSADGTSADGTSHLPTFCPICRHAIPSADGPICRRDKMLADGPSHLPTGPSGYTLPNLHTGRQQMGHPIRQHFAQSADILSNLHTGQNVPRWAILSADPPVCRWDKMLADGPSHLPTERVAR